MPPRLAGLAAVVLLALTACTSAVSAPPPAPPPVLRVMSLGDSITRGYQSTAGTGYRGRLWDRAAGQNRYRINLVGSRHGGVLPDADHEGHDGYTVAQTRASIDDWLMAAQPDIVILHIGINDLDHSGDPAATADQLADLVGRIYARQPDVTVLLLGLIPTTDGLQHQVAVYNAQAAAISWPRLHYIPAPALGPGEMADRLHPDDCGYQALGDAIYAALDHVL